MHAGGLKRGKHASALDRQWRQKRVLMRPEAAFPYVFAAEGAQHPPNQPPRPTPLAAAQKKRMTAVILLWYCLSRPGLALPDDSARFGPPETLSD